jgi:mannan endo-1,4-beta-mannosidase
MRIELIGMPTQFVINNYKYWSARVRNYRNNVGPPAGVTSIYIQTLSYMKARKITLMLTAMLAVFFSSVVFGQTRFKSLNYLYSVSGSRTLSGQHNDQKDGTGAATYTNRVFSITGKYPALYSADFLFHGNSQMRWDVTYEAERQWNAGAVVNFMWHACPPTQGAVCDWDGGVLSKLSNDQWNDLITDGGNLNRIWKSRIDEISVYLQYLEDKGVEVLWRPLHEMNQARFWYGGRKDSNGTKRLYQITRDYMTNVKGLTNLIWVWNVQDISEDYDYSAYNPGSNYFDIASLDIYADGYTNMTYYNALVAQAGGKPVAIGECGPLPGADVFSRQPRWTFFMNWAYLLQQNNSDQHIRDVYNNPRVITRDEMPGWGSVSVPNNLAKGKPVTVSSNESGSSNVAANAVDGNYGSRWSSAYSNNQWIRVDLGARYNINRVKISWEDAYATSYRIEVSPDGTNWSTLRSVTKNTAGADDIGSFNGTGRYLRIYGLTRATVYGFSIWEIEAYGSPAGSGGGNLALGKSVVTTSNENASLTGANAVDGNASTRWSSQYANNQNFIVDLGGNFNVNRIKIVWESAYARDYQIQVSTDNTSWRTVRDFWGKPTSAADDYTGMSETARWVKVYCITRATSYGFSIHEFEVYGTSSGARIAAAEADEVSQTLQAFPNPVNDKVLIKLPVDSKGGNIRLKNSVGQSVISDKTSGDEHTFDLSGLPSGLYLINFSNKHHRLTKKIIKN